MKIEKDIVELNRKVDMIWSVLQHVPFNTGLGINFQSETKKFKRPTTKDQLWTAITKSWNDSHPLYKVKP